MWSFGLRQLEPFGVKARGVGGVGVAAAGFVRLDRFLAGRERHRFERHVVGAEIIGEIELRGGALLHADRGVVELQRRGDLERLAHHEALAVEERDGREIEPERGVARQRPRRIARQHVDFARLQRGEPILGRQRHEFDLAGIVEDRGGDGAAEIDVEAGPVALRIGQAEAGQRAVGAADEFAAILDRAEGLRMGGRHRQRRYQRAAKSRSKTFHDQAFRDGPRAEAPRFGVRTRAFSGKVATGFSERKCDKAEPRPHSGSTETESSRPARRI